MQRNATVKPGKLQLLCEVLLSLNLALVLFYYSLVRSLIEASHINDTSDAYSSCIISSVPQSDWTEFCVTSRPAMRNMFDG